MPENYLLFGLWALGEENTTEIACYHLNSIKIILK